MDLRKWLSILCLVLSLVLIVYGSVVHEWDVAEHAAVFLALGILPGLIAGFGPSEISREFLAGCKDMLRAAMIIGLARSIGGIMSDGNIIDTVVHALAGGLGGVPLYLQGVGMLLANTVINVFITSGSGQGSGTFYLEFLLTGISGRGDRTVQGNHPGSRDDGRGICGCESIVLPGQ